LPFFKKPKFTIKIFNYQPIPLTLKNWMKHIEWFLIITIQLYLNARNQWNNVDLYYFSTFILLFIQYQLHFFSWMKKEEFFLKLIMKKNTTGEKWTKRMVEIIWLMDGIFLSFNSELLFFLLNLTKRHSIQFLFLYLFFFFASTCLWDELKLRWNVWLSTSLTHLPCLYIHSYTRL